MRTLILALLWALPVLSLQAHTFIVADNAGQHGVQVFDLTRLRDFTGEPIEFDEDAIYTEIASAHNIVINEQTGFAYTVGNSGGGKCSGGGGKCSKTR